jgi:hypothetical protein
LFNPSGFDGILLSPASQLNSYVQQFCLKACLHG